MLQPIDDDDDENRVLLESPTEIDEEGDDSILPKLYDELDNECYDTIEVPETANIDDEVGLLWVEKIASAQAQLVEIEYALKYLR